MKNLAGDTLVEVTLAVGIFSMIAIGVVAIMSGGTSSAQTALETTLTREEIDTQAEALRFIQSAYIASKDSGDSHYADLWEKIADRAVSINDDNAVYITGIPSQCSKMYDNPIFDSKAFIINPRTLDDPSANPIIEATSQTFTPAATYPRLIYSQSQLDNTDALISNNTASTLYRAEGIYVIAVKDSNTTKIIQDLNINPNATEASAFYDFYIRACWYETSDETPSTISTVIRLHNPLATSDISSSHDNRPITVYFMDNDGNRTQQQITVSPIQSGIIPNPDFPPPPQYEFQGWTTNINNSLSTLWHPGDEFVYNSTYNKTIELYPKYKKKSVTVTIKYNANGGSGTTSSQSVQSVAEEEGTGKDIFATVS